MQRIRAYKLGVFFIFFATLFTPISYLALGRIEKGRVVEIIFEYSGVSVLPSSAFPRIEFKYQSQTYSMIGGENDKLLVGEEIKVIFFNNNPAKAKIYSFWGLFIDSIIQLPLGLLIWWAFFKSYPKMFESN
ncbi:MAG: hypothetical protein EHM93_17520 [Bacteroidales bacterium]|jgi:hypothetical protein|nr:MAG: hypothetical protein EHM93_17520 [Bacteroidales bacterium]